MEDLVADEWDYTIPGPVEAIQEMVSLGQTPRAVDELMAAGNLRELDELLQNARDIDYNEYTCWSCTNNLQIIIV
jgi:hypothetical protein